MVTLLLVGIEAALAALLGRPAGTTPGVPMAALGVIVIAGVAVAWKWELIGGILLITEALFVMLNAFPGVFAGDLHGFFTFELYGLRATTNEIGLVGSALIALAGILFLISWLKERNASSVTSSSSTLKRGDQGVS